VVIVAIAEGRSFPKTELRIHLRHHDAVLIRDPDVRSVEGDVGRVPNCDG
jgi:hypothetical protein